MGCLVHEWTKAVCCGRGWRYLELIPVLVAREKRAKSRRSRRARGAVMARRAWTERGILGHRSVARCCPQPRLLRGLHVVSRLYLRGHARVLYSFDALSRLLSSFGMSVHISLSRAIALPARPGFARSCQILYFLRLYTVSQLYGRCCFHTPNYSNCCFTA